MNPFSLENLAPTYKIIDKHGTLVPFTFNVYQIAIDALVKRLEHDRLPVRIIVLKPRQTGLSTWCQGYIYNKATTNFFTRCMVIADDEKNTNNLFNMSKNFYDYSPADIRPMRKASNEKALIFGNPDSRDEDRGLSSFIKVETAGKGTAGRSGTLQHVHCSEFAFWPKAGETVSGLFNSVPAVANTSIFIESTANGMTGKGQEFYDRWNKAIRNERDGGVGFKPIFFPWFWNPEYEMDADPYFRPNKEEQSLLKLYPQLTDRKLFWRRYKIENEMGSAVLDPLDQFHQEYPSSPQDAFISSGRAVFDNQAINEHLKRLEGLDYKTGLLDENGRFYERADGPYKIFIPVKSSWICAIGADVAQGLATGDHSTMSMINRDLQIFGSYFGHIAPDLFGKELLKAGKYCNEGLLAPEINNHGHVVLSVIKQDYSNIYTRQVQEQRSDEYTDSLGWLSTLKSKMKMLDDYVAAYRDKSIEVYDIELLKEMMTLFVEEDGDISLNGKDRVVSAMIALQAIKQVPYDQYGAEFPMRRPARFVDMKEKLQWLKENRDREQYEPESDDDY